MVSGSNFRALVTALVVPPMLMQILSGCGVSMNSPDLLQERSARSLGAASGTVVLPFGTTFTQRWNERNDGTSYEPCAALDGVALAHMGIDPRSVRDGAGTDGQTARGCRWTYAPVNENPTDWIVSQSVGDYTSLMSYQEKYSWRHWLPNTDLSGRGVGVSGDAELGECLTYVQSGGAGVVTLVVHHGLPHPPVQEVCDRALAFTEATIGKMPR